MKPLETLDRRGQVWEASWEGGSTLFLVIREPKRWHDVAYHELLNLESGHLDAVDERNLAKGKARLTDWRRIA